MGLFKWIKRKLEPPKPPAKWLLEPRRDGDFDLMRYNDDLKTYWFEGIVDSEEAAAEAIEQLERPTIALEVP